MSFSWLKYTLSHNPISIEKRGVHTKQTEIVRFNLHLCIKNTCIITANSNVEKLKKCQTADRREIHDVIRNLLSQELIRNDRSALRHQSKNPARNYNFLHETNIGIQD